MRILRVVSDLYPTVVGGIGIHAHEMSRIQSDMGNEVTVLTFAPKNAEHLKKIDYKLIQIPFLFKLWGNTFSFSFPFKILRIKDNFDVIHAHSHLFFSTNICAFIRKFNSTPLIITNHGIMSASAPDWFNLLYLKTIGKWTLNAADGILCYTKDEKEKLIEILHIDESKIFIIPNGVDTDQFHPGTRNLDTDTINLLWVGRFVKGKGVEYIIRAMDILVKEYPNLHLILVGDGPEKDRICKLITDFKINDYVRIIDFIPYDEMPDIFQHGDIFILPSLNEGVPRTVLEAMSCGLPVVISDLSHLKDLIDGGGLMFQKKDVEGLSKILESIINDPAKREEMGQKARDKILKEYSFIKTVTETINAYKKTLMNLN